MSGFSTGGDVGVVADVPLAATPAAAAFEASVDADGVSAVFAAQQTYETLPCIPQVPTCVILVSNPQDVGRHVPSSFVQFVSSYVFVYPAGGGTTAQHAGLSKSGQFAVNILYLYAPDPGYCAEQSVMLIHEAPVPAEAPDTPHIFGSFGTQQVPGDLYVGLPTSVSTQLVTELFAVYPAPQLPMMTEPPTLEHAVVHADENVAA